MKHQLQKKTQINETLLKDTTPHGTETSLDPPSISQNEISHTSRKKKQSAREYETHAKTPTEEDASIRSLLFSEGGR